MKPTFIIHQSSQKCGKLYNIMESQGNAFARLHILTDCIHFEEYNVWITDLEVTEEKRRQGYATCMLRQILSLVPTNESIAVEVNQDTPHWVVEFYEKNGIIVANKDDLALEGKEKEAAEQRIHELDLKAEELKLALDQTTDEEEEERLLDELMSVYRETNHWLRAIGADENQLYDL